MSLINKVKQLINPAINNDLLVAIVFEMGRFYDSNFTAEIKRIQKENHIVIDSSVRKQMRKQFYYGNLYSIKTKALD